MDKHRDVLVPVLEEGRRLGFLGPGPVAAHLQHAAGFASVLEAIGGDMRRGADLGSGAGVPGLPLALHFGAMEWVLVDASHRRSAFLRVAVRDLGLDGRVSVVTERAEVVGRTAGFRATFDAVVARGFGPPAAAAECAAPLLRVGGRLLVSEPPGGSSARWDEAGLAQLGLVPGPARQAGGAAYQVLVQSHGCPPRFPRRVGVPAKRPLFPTPAGKKNPQGDVPRETRA